MTDGWTTGFIHVRRFSKSSYKVNEQSLHRNRMHDSDSEPMNLKFHNGDRALTALTLTLSQRERGT